MKRIKAVKVKIEINKELFEKLKSYQTETSFKKIEDFIQYILEEYLLHEVNKPNVKDKRSDKEILNDRLKNLGYL